MTTVCVETRSLKSQPIPAHYRARFERIYTPLPDASS
jgi:acyl-CoA thioesterase FadM